MAAGRSTGAGALSSGGDEDHRRVVAHQSRDLVARLVERSPRDLRVVSGAEKVGGLRANQQAFVWRHVHKRILIGIEKTGRDAMRRRFVIDAPLGGEIALI